MPVRRLVGVPSRRVGPTGAASPVGSDCARTPRCLGARLLLRGFQGGDLLRQSLGTVSGVVVVRIDRRCRAHEQPCGTHPALRRAMAEERLWLPQRGGVSVCGADVDRGPNPAVAETSGAGLPVSRDRSPSVRPSRSAITGPGRGLNGYSIILAPLHVVCAGSNGILEHTALRGPFPSPLSQGRNPKFLFRKFGGGSRAAQRVKFPLADRS